MYHILTNKSISDGEILQGEGFLIDGGRIVDRGPIGELDAKGAEVLDLRGLTTMPGFVDIHAHGAMGFDVMDGTYEALDKISAYKMKEGCTSFCPTTVTGPMDKTLAAVKNVKAAMDKGVSGAKIIGTFLEGPYINPRYKGAHPEEYILPIDLESIKKLIAAGEGSVVSIIIAPELPGAVSAIETLVNMGVQVRLGHSAATAGEAEAGVAAGANLCVHCYNAMSPLHHREPGMVGAVLTNHALKAELICDLVHVHPDACKVLAQAKGSGGTVIVTDCMAASGLADGKYKLGEITVQVTDGISRMPDNTLAGSTATMMACVCNMAEGVGVPLEEAVQMATATPAQILGMYDKIGSLDLGKCADIIGVDDDWGVRFVMIDGLVRQKM